VYMAVGSLVTVAVLAIAALQGPKWFKRSEASSSAPPTVVEQPTQPQRQPQQQPLAEQPIETAPVQTPTAAAPPLANVRQASPIAQNTAPAARVPAQQTQPAPTAGSPLVLQQSPPPVVQQQAVQTQSAAPAEDAAKVAAVREARDHLMMLGTRANSVRATLVTMKQAQARQGLGMRGDILTAEQRMENFLDDAQAAVRAGDLEGAKKALASAEREIDRVEGFLGR
jgi:eukaryotic-like serine/threonine-protein kinase